jgi:hypothetical protein
MTEVKESLGFYKEAENTLSYSVRVLVKVHRIEHHMGVFKSGFSLSSK